MELSKLTPAHAVLARFVGRWSGAEHLHPTPSNPSRRDAHGKFDLQLVCEGFFLTSNYEQWLDDACVYRGHGVYGYEPTIERYTMYWFDILGGGGYTHPVLGTFDDDRLAFRQPGETGISQYVYEFVSDDEFTFRLEFSKDGTAWATQLDGRYRRI